MKKTILMILVILAVLNAATLDSQIKAQQKNQSDMKKKIQQYNAIARKKSQESKTLLSQLSRLRQNASESASKMDDLERENSKLQASVNELNQNIARVNESIRHILEMLRARLTDLYKFTPNENGIHMIFASDGAHDAVNTAYMLNIFARQDIEMFAELNAKERELNEARTKLEADRSKIATQTDELRKKREEFNTTIKKTDNLLKNVQSEQKKAEAAAKELENAQKAVGKKITNLLNQKKKKKTSTAKTTQSKTQASSTPSSVKALAWPINGTVTMQYGSRVHPTFKTKIFNSGIDIRASAGAPVKAAASGEVLYQGWLRGLGQVVIIDHGGDLTTVYAHLGATSVREGSKVNTGTVIGRIGNTGTDAEYGLHFEVRRNGSAVDPMTYLRK